MNYITPLNWNHCHYESRNLRALVSIGALPINNDVSIQYYVTVIDENENDLFQTDFKSCEAACEYINKKYSSIWNLNDLSVSKSSESGCSTCVAH